MNKTFCFLCTAAILGFAAHPDVFAEDAVQQPVPPVNVKASSAKTISLGRANAGKTVKASIGDTIIIELDGNITTGYSWEPDGKFNAAILTLANSDYKTDANPNGLAGVGGRFVFRFTVKGAGKTTVKLEYKRPWEKDTPPIENFTVEIDAAGKTSEAQKPVAPPIRITAATPMQEQAKQKQNPGESNPANPDAVRENTEKPLPRFTSEQLRRIVERDRARAEWINQRVKDGAAEAAAEKRVKENPPVLTPGKTPEGWMDDVSAAVAKAKKENKPILALFTGSDWCPPCKKLALNVLTSPDFESFAKEKLVLLFVDFPKEAKIPEARQAQNDKLAREFAVQGYPTGILLSSDGKTKLWSSVGYSINFLNMLNEAVEKNSSPAQDTVSGKKILLDMKDSGKTIEAGVGDTIVLTVEAKVAMPAAFVWDGSDRFNKDILSLLREDKVDENKPGEKTTFSYLVKGTGKAEIVLRYIQKSEQFDETPLPPFDKSHAGRTHGKPIVSFYVTVNCTAKTK